MDEPLIVEILVDPACPWAWLTSRWLLEVEQVRNVRVRTRLFDLAETNRGEQDERMLTSHSAGETALRTLVQARREGGAEALGRLYTELGEAWHERAEQLSEPDTLERAAVAAGLPADLPRRALSDPTTLDELLAEHRDAAAGGAFGVPTLRLPGTAAWFGPIVDTRITAEAAGELWDAVLPLLRNPHLFELKRERAGKAEIGRYRAVEAAATA